MPSAPHDYTPIRLISSGADGCAYEAVIGRPPQRVEAWHLNDEWCEPQQLALLEQRIQRIRLAADPVLQSVMHLLREGHRLVLLRDYVGVDSVERRIKESQLDPQLLFPFLRDAARGLAAAHSVGLVHGHMTRDALKLVENSVRIDVTQLDVGKESRPTGPNGRSSAREIPSADDTLDLAQFALCVKDCMVLPWVMDVGRSAAPVTWEQLRERIESMLADREALTRAGWRDLEGACAAIASELSQNQRGKQPVSSTAGLAGAVTRELSNSDPHDAATADMDIVVLTDSAVPDASLVGSQLGRFLLERKLGQGGMGAVYRASDVTSGETVAIKVLSQLRSQQAHAIRRFYKEARLLASVNNPHVTKLIEINEHQGTHYLVMEYVEGVDLKQVIQANRVLSERFALQVIADVCRALVDAHVRNIVHRDIKPENILLASDVSSIGLDASPPPVKLADFGIARHLDQSESLALTQVGTLLGTPLYMSPEQCSGEAQVVPQSDVYSIGVTLYEMLAGRTPFVSHEAMKLAAMHTYDRPEALRKWNPAISEAVEQIVGKCLAKSPQDRFADAGQLLRAIDRHLRGEVSNVALHPRIPPHDLGQVVGNEMVWELESPPESLWPYVTNTERLNRAMGLPAIRYRSEPLPAGGIRRWGMLRLRWLDLTWEEHPFEWVEGQRMSVLREFMGGPFHWFLSRLELRRTPRGGSELRHTIQILPRHWFGRLIAKIETGKKCHRGLDRVYRRIDRTLTAYRRGSERDNATDVDAFEPEYAMSVAERRHLDQRMARLMDLGVSAELIERLETLLATAPAQEVARIRPLALAVRWNVDASQLMDATLLGCREGLFNVGWDILCPTCRVAARTLDSLKQLAAHTHCEACHLDFKSDQANSVELILRAHPDLRRTDVGQYCIGGPWHAPHVVAQIRLEPHECTEMELRLGVGEYLLRGPRMPQTLRLTVQSNQAPSQLDVVLGSTLDDRKRWTMRAGQQLIKLENRGDSFQIIRMERTIPRDDVLTAAQASAMPRFRELFPGEIFDTGQVVATDRLTLLATQLSDVDEIYTRYGDRIAYGLMQQHLSAVESIIVQQRGEVVKSMGEGVLAVFYQASDAIDAAFKLQESGSGVAELASLPLAIGVHQGPVVMTTSNGRLDYFGLTARQAVALPGSYGQGVGITEAVLAGPSAPAELSDRTLIREVKRVDLPGRPNEVVHWFGVG